MREHSSSPEVPSTPEEARSREIDASGIQQAEVDPLGWLRGQLDSEQLGSARIGRGALISLLTVVMRRCESLRVEVRELDGIAHEDRAISAAPEPSTTATSKLVVLSDSYDHSDLFEVAGYGFVPGEDVAIAPILLQISASADARARALIETGQTVDEVLVFGRVSGTIHIIRTRS